MNVSMIHAEPQNIVLMEMEVMHAILVKKDILSKIHHVLVCFYHYNIKILIVW